MNSSSTNASKSTGRRQFLKSLLGLGSVIEASKVEARPASPEGMFYWADLRTGQVGFPSGATAPSGCPGSVMKLVAAAVVAEEGLVSTDRQIECTGSIEHHGRTYACPQPHGSLTLVEAIGYSCNSYFVELSKHIGPGLLLDYVNRLGLQQCVAGYAGLPPVSQFRGTSVPYVLGLEPSFRVNALQLMQLSALIALEGESPYFFSAENPDPNGTPFRAELRGSTWSVLRDGMTTASRRGTAAGLDPENKLAIACKTGTAPHGKKFQSWVTGFFPVENPRHVFCARGLSGISSQSAVPVAKKYLFSTDWP